MRTYLEAVVREPELHERDKLADFGRQVKQSVAVEVELPNAVHLGRQQHTSAFVSIRRQNAAYVSICQLPNAVHLRHRRVCV